MPSEAADSSSPAAAAAAASGAAAAAAPLRADRRIAWLKRRICAAYQGCVEAADYESHNDPQQTAVFRDFFNQSNAMCLFVRLRSSASASAAADADAAPSAAAAGEPEVLAAAAGYPVVSTTAFSAEELNGKKGLYFLKRTPAQVSLDNVESLFHAGDVHPSVLQGLVDAENTVLPSLLAAGADACGGGGDDDGAAVLREQAKFRSELRVAKGWAEARCHLAVPLLFEGSRRQPAAAAPPAAPSPGRRSLRGHAVPADASVAYELETAVVAWTGQIKRIIGRMPDVLFDADHGATRGVPSTVDEADFWSEKAADLRCAQAELSSPPVLRVCAALRAHRSPYAGPFEDLRTGPLRLATLEAADNARCLAALVEADGSPLPALLGRPSAAAADGVGRPPPPLDVLAADGAFARLFHLVLLVWAESRHYNTAARIFGLVRLLANDVVAAADRFAGVRRGRLLAGPAAAAAEKLGACVAAVQAFKAAYFAAKAEAERGGSGVVALRRRRPSQQRAVGTAAWAGIDNKAVFRRVDGFLERCHDVLDALDTGLLFESLDPSGGGAAASAAAAAASPQLAGLRAAHDAAFGALHRRGLRDVLDPADAAFDADYGVYRAEAARLEAAAGSALARALRAAREAPLGAARLVQSLGALGERAGLARHWQAQQAAMVAAQAADVVEARRLFEEGRRRTRAVAVVVAAPTAPAAVASEDSSPLLRMPPLRAELAWCRMLAGRVDEPHERLRTSLSAAAVSSEGWHAYAAAAAGLARDVRRHAAGLREQWAAAAAAAVQAELERPLLLLLPRKRERTGCSDDDDDNDAEKGTGKGKEQSGGDNEDEERGGNEVAVNFSEALDALLRDHSAASGRQEEDGRGGEGCGDDAAVLLAGLSERAHAVFSDEDAVRRRVLRLRALCASYNASLAGGGGSGGGVPKDVLPLVRTELAECAAHAAAGATGVTWLSDDADAFVAAAEEAAAHAAALLAAVDAARSGARAALDAFRVADTLLPLGGGGGGGGGGTGGGAAGQQRRLQTPQAFCDAYAAYKFGRARQALAASAAAVDAARGALCGAAAAKAARGGGVLAEGGAEWRGVLRLLNEEVGAGVEACALHTLQGLRLQMDGELLREREGAPFLEVRLVAGANKRRGEGGGGGGGGGVGSFVPPLGSVACADDAAVALARDVLDSIYPAAASGRVGGGDAVGGCAGGAGEEAAAATATAARRVSSSMVSRLREATRTFTVSQHVGFWVEEAAQMASCFAVLVAPGDAAGCFLARTRRSAAVATLSARVRALCAAAVDGCEAFRRSMLRHAYLCDASAEASFAAFLEEAAAAAAAERLRGDAGAVPPPPPPPPATLLHGGASDGAQRRRRRADSDAAWTAAYGDEAAREAARCEAEVCGGARLADFERMLAACAAVQAELSALPDAHASVFLSVDARPLKAALLEAAGRWRAQYTGFLEAGLRQRVAWAKAFVAAAEASVALLARGDGADDEADQGLRRLLHLCAECRGQSPRLRAVGPTLRAAAAALRRHGAAAEAEALSAPWAAVPAAWAAVEAQLEALREANAGLREEEAARLEDEAAAAAAAAEALGAELEAEAPFGRVRAAEEAYARLDAASRRLRAAEAAARRVWDAQALLGVARTPFPALAACRGTLGELKRVWDVAAHVRDTLDGWLGRPFADVDFPQLSRDLRALRAALALPGRAARRWPCYACVAEEVGALEKAVPLLTALQEPAVASAAGGRHWLALLREMGHGEDDGGATEIAPLGSSLCTLHDVVCLGLPAHAAAVAGCVERAVGEGRVERGVACVEQAWEVRALEVEERLGCLRLAGACVDSLLDAVEADSAALQRLLASPFAGASRVRAQAWTDRLGRVEAVAAVWLGVQRRLCGLAPIFATGAGSLPDEEGARFRAAEDAYGRLMQAVRRTPSALAACCGVAPAGAQAWCVGGEQYSILGAGAGSVDDVLAAVSGELAVCERRLAEHLWEKRLALPRLCFVADADIVDILSHAGEPRRVMAHVPKLVPALSTFCLAGGGDGGGAIAATAMEGAEGEIVSFVESVACDGPVEAWLAACVAAMRRAVHACVAAASAALLEAPRAQWAAEHCGQAVVAAARLQFGWEVAGAFAAADAGGGGGGAPFGELAKQCERNVRDDVALLRDAAAAPRRALLARLVALDVQHRDGVQALVRAGAEEESDFAWQAQLRYGWDERAGEGGAGGVVVHLLDFEGAHGGEYVGAAAFLVSTPLTDRCHITLTQALKMARGGAPTGPAGTGKTETTKDLARSLGLACFVLNCSGLMTPRGLAQLFKGLAMEGCWGCLDEFDRISAGVLSVVAAQVASLQRAAGERRAAFKLAGEDEDVPLRPSCGIFVTMNPGYRGRTELPPGLRVLFRPCAMTAPDLAMICETLLLSEGFSEAEALAAKLAALYRLCGDLLPPQAHHDWGLRTAKAALARAGVLRRAGASEEAAFVRAVRGATVSRLSEDDARTFDSLADSLFASAAAEANAAAAASTAGQPAAALCHSACASLGLLPGDDGCVVARCVQLTEALEQRHCVFLVGEAGCGKTTLVKVAREALGVADGAAVRCRWLGPNALPAEELYGRVHEGSGEWAEGHLGRVFKDFSEQGGCPASPSRAAAAVPRKWIVLDGEVDPLWIESMNTVMDDTRLLTLTNGDRVPLTPSMRLLFEAEHLRNATPATVSRAGVVFVGGGGCGGGAAWATAKEAWLATLRDPRERGFVDCLLDYYLPPALARVRTMLGPPDGGGGAVAPHVETGAVQGVCAYLDALLRPVPPASIEQAAYERCVAFAVVWGVGGALPAEGARLDYRAAFSLWWRANLQERCRVAASDGRRGVFDYGLRAEDGFAFRPWEVLRKAEGGGSGSFFPRASPFSAALVATVDAVRTTWLARLLVGVKRGVLIAGGGGVGKSALAEHAVRSMVPAETYASKTLTLTACSQAADVRAAIEGRLEKRGRRWRPYGGRRLLVVLDDLHAPLPGRCGNREALAFVRQVADRQHWYESGAPGVERSVCDLQFVAVATHAAGSAPLPPRLTRWLSALALPHPPPADLRTIYGAVLGAAVAAAAASADGEGGNGDGGGGSTWPVPLRDLACGAVVAATVALHGAVRAAFPPAAGKLFHRWSLRDLGGIVEGLSLLQVGEGSGGGSGCGVLPLLRFWRFECERTLRDRLQEEEDEAAFDGLLREVAAHHFCSDADDAGSGGGGGSEDTGAKTPRRRAAVVAAVEDIVGGPNIWVPFQCGDAGGAAAADADTAGEAAAVDAEEDDADAGLYAAAPSLGALRAAFEDRLAEHNADPSQSPLDVMLFSEAVEHVARITRVLTRPRGNMILLGVGGSGKRSLARLAMLVAGLDPATPAAEGSGGGGAQLAKTVAELYVRCGQRGERVGLHLSDAQIVCSEHLVLLHGVLSGSGEVPGLFEPAEADEVARAMIPQLRALHLEFRRELCWEYFLRRVQDNLHTVLCVSPAAEPVEAWVRRFPSVAAAGVVDWVRAWPHRALVGVAERILREEGVEEEEEAEEGEEEEEDEAASAEAQQGGDEEEGDLAAQAAGGTPAAPAPTTPAQQQRRAASLLADAQGLFLELAAELRRATGRAAHATPRTLMDAATCYKGLLAGRRLEACDRRARLRDGLAKLRRAKEGVGALQALLGVKEEEVAAAAKEAEVLVGRIGREKAACAEEAERGQAERLKTERLVAETDALWADAEKDLAAAQPMVERAKGALRGLKKAALVELRSFSIPPPDVNMVTAAVMCLTAHPERIPPVDKALDWMLAKRMMGNATTWVKELEELSDAAHRLPQACVDAIQVWVRHPGFAAENMRTKSEAAAGLALWVTHMDAYHTLRCLIRPKEDRLHEANQRLEASRARHRRVQDQAIAVQERLRGLVDAHAAAAEKTRALQQEALATRLKLGVAGRLVAALATERARWERSLSELRAAERPLAGSLLCACVFVAYAGLLDLARRDELCRRFAERVRASGLPLDAAGGGGCGAADAASAAALATLACEAEVAAWENEGLPGDRHSVGNGAIVKHSGRWPLLVDPQLQGLRWIKAREDANGLVVTRQCEATFLDKLAYCMETGVPCLVENLPDGPLHPALGPLLAREISCPRGDGVYTCPVGEREVALHLEGFRLYLQTQEAAPSYRPELHAQTAMVDFGVSAAGLEQQLLSATMRSEHPALEERRVALVRRANQCRVDLARCEDRVLYGLSSAEGDLLKNVALVTTLERTVRRAAAIARAIADATEARHELEARSRAYWPVAARGAQLFFATARLCRVEGVYRVSLEAFADVFSAALRDAPPAPQEGEEEQAVGAEAATDELVYESIPKGCSEREKKRVVALVAAVTEKVLANEQNNFLSEETTH